MKRMGLLALVVLLAIASVAPVAPVALGDGAPYEITVYDEAGGAIAAVDTLVSDEPYDVLERMLPLPGTPWATLLRTSGQIEWRKIAYEKDGQPRTGWIVGNPGVLMDGGELSDADAASGFVLCASLTVRESASAAARAVCTLEYGSTVRITARDSDWMRVSVQTGVAASGDVQTQTGWVRADYVLVDPTMYTSAGETAVYAYPGEDSPRVALLGSGETHPIIARLEGYTVISLRGASGFIRE